MLNYKADYTGADPTKLVEDLARKKRIRTLSVSMGQGQEIIARNYLTAAIIDGQWLLLQNTHLGLSYLTEVRAYSLLNSIVTDAGRRRVKDRKRGR